jgi:hypothetical protein
MKRFAVASLLTFAACTDGGSPSGPRPTTRLDLQAATGLVDVKPVGVSVDPAGNRYFFDEAAGLFQLDAAGHATMRMAADAMPVPAEPVMPPFTDLLALAPDLFALTAIGDGYLLDTTAGTLTQHFCYVPDGTPVWLWQRTDALAYDAATDRLYAQPLTYDMENVLQSAEILGYDRTTGEIVEWNTLEPGALQAGGMAILPGSRIIAAQGSQLVTFDRDRYQVTPLLDLESTGARRIEGLAYDAARDTLLVVDGATQSLYEIDAAGL